MDRTYRKIDRKKTLYKAITCHKYILKLEIGIKMVNTIPEKLLIFNLDWIFLEITVEQKLNVIPAKVIMEQNGQHQSIQEFVVPSYKQQVKQLEDDRGAQSADDLS